MTRANVNIATLYSSAQCVLSVVGSVGVILLFAGIPQLIYSPTVSIANLLTFILGAILITTMVAGNSFLNYKYRKFTRSSQQSQRDVNGSEAAANRVETDDKPPSYEAILTLDGLPPDYFSIISEKPPRYEDVTASLSTPAGTIVPVVPIEGDVSEVNASNREQTTQDNNSFKEVTSPTTTTSSKTEKEDLSTSTPKHMASEKSGLTAQLTLGYDNEAYSDQGEVPVSSSSNSMSLDLRESES